MDIVDEIISDWATQRPDIDCSGKAVVSRILRSNNIIIAAVAKALKPLDINPTIFSALVTIRRKGPRAEITVKTIVQEALVTSGGASNLLNQLLKLKLITKRKGTQKEDSRSVFVKLTPKGLALIDQAMEIQAAAERKITQNLTATEKRQLTHLLKKIQLE